MSTAGRIHVLDVGGDHSPMGIYDPLGFDGHRLVLGPYLAFVVEHSAGRVLFDTGMHPKWVTAGPALRIAVAESDLLPGALARIGLEPADIAHVVVSHLHYDHAGGLQYLTHAPCECSAPSCASPALRPATRPSSTTPGHTPGHQSLRVELPSGTHVLAPDAWYA